MRASLLRDRLAGIQMIGEDLPQRTNTVDLDPKVKDYRGVPVARITYSPHQHELRGPAASTSRCITALIKAAGADVAVAVPETSSDHVPGRRGRRTRRRAHHGRHAHGRRRPQPGVTDAGGASTAWTTSSWPTVRCSRPRGPQPDAHDHGDGTAQRPPLDRRPGTPRRGSPRRAGPTPP